MNIFKDKILLTVIASVILVATGIFLIQSYSANNRKNNEEPPIPPPEEETLTYEGKIYSTPKDAQFDDYFVVSDGREYGIEADIADSSLGEEIINYRDTEIKVEIEGQLYENVIDYGGRHIKVKSIKEKEILSVGIANPASVYCEQEGGILSPIETEKGTMSMCIFEDFECEEWAYFRGECTKEEANILLESCEEFKEANICTEQYEPVCVRIISEDGNPIWETFSNNCFACIEEGVVFGYVNGECK